MQDVAFDSDDVGLIEATVSNLYSKLRISASGANTRARITRRVVAPEIGFDDLEYSFDIGYAGEIPGLLILCDVVSNTIRRIGEGHDETFGPGEMFVISRPELPYAGIAHGPRLRFTVIDPAVLTHIASSIGGETESVRVTDHRPVSSQAVANLRRAITYVRNNVIAAPGEGVSPLVISTSTQLIAAHVLNAFPSTAVTGPTSTDSHDANPDALHRAISYIEANPDAALTLVDIARAAYVTPRALQLTFRRHLNTTPMAYLRRVRLQCAHDELEAAVPGEGTTVGRVAVDWGFTNASRFARYYREVYCRSPSDTLAD